jgi:diguanylate cyclase (GGDEF)-like protein
VEAADFSPASVTLSVGIALWRAREQTLSQALDAADRALYVAKRSGRNRVEYAGSPSAV